MDLKKEAARVAYTMISNNSSVGLGDGITIRWLADYIIEGIKNGLTIKLYTSSLQTSSHFQKAGITLSDIAEADNLDQYFDGCDQVDSQLNVFKSGAGIHTTEKLLASIADHFIILADASKFVLKLENKFPLVVEVLPQATLFFIKKMKSGFPGVSISIRNGDTMKSPVITRYGNYLLDCHFTDLPDLEFLQNYCKNTTGVVEISLFFKMATDAIIVDEERVRKFKRKNNQVVQTD